MDSDKKTSLTIRMPNEMQKGVYANIVSVTVGVNEIVIDFAFQLPVLGQSHAEGVSRVVLSPDVGKKFLSAFQNAVLDFEKQSIKLKSHENK